jgi:hypothetical protein
MDHHHHHCLYNSVRVLVSLKSRPLARLLLGFVSMIIFTVWGRQPHAQPPTWRTSTLLLVWVITFDLSGKGDPASTLRYRRHSSQGHLTTLAPPLRQGRDTFGGENMDHKIGWLRSSACLEEPLSYIVWKPLNIWSTNFGQLEHTL